MVEHQTQLHVLDDNIKSLTESQSSLSDSQNALRQDFDLLVTSFDEQKALLHELVSQHISSQSSSPAPSLFLASQNPLGQHKPASVQLARFSVNNPLLLPPPHGPDPKLSSVDPSSPLQSAISYNALAGGCSVSTLRKFDGREMRLPLFNLYSSMGFAA
ncbi:hypothetical protein GOBAR_DD09836 [Gossypium barbadense]|nr:hypothetical protein GOBAR_DD09836 [Gossypium barbadense]